MIANGVITSDKLEASQKIRLMVLEEIRNSQTDKASVCQMKGGTRDTGKIRLEITIVN